MSPRFHPAVEDWFAEALGPPTAPQRAGWPHIQAGRHTLIAAPTGSGKTLAAFLCAIDGLLRQGLEEPLPEACRVLYVSPLKALASDIERNLQEPLRETRRRLEDLGLEAPAIRVAVRSGDTPQRVRAQMVKRPPHIVVTTPESLAILLTSHGGRGILKTTETVIVDEIHAVVGSKRGTHLALSLERLDALVQAHTGRVCQRIGLSATQKPIEDVARFLVGAARVDQRGRADCAVVDAGTHRALDLSVSVPSSPLEAIMANEVWEEIYDGLANRIQRHRTTLVFVNTRRLAERAARHLSERLGAEHVGAHHGSLARDRRHDMERQLKAGQLKVLVATASLELGIDIGAVDLVCQLGSPGSIASTLQRVGRSRHQVGGTPKGVLFPLSRDDLCECAALMMAVRAGALESLRIPTAPLDILAQHVVACAAMEDWSEAELLAMVRKAWPYRGLTVEQLDEVLSMLSVGFSTRWGRRGAYLHRDRVHGRVRGRRNARLAALTSGGAIPETGEYQVKLEPGGLKVGSVNEDFAIESLPGDVFQLGTASWRILKIEPGLVRVSDAQGEPPNIPFWFGEAPGRSPELSAAVAELRGRVWNHLDGSDHGAAAAWLTDSVGLPEAAAEQLAEHLAAGALALGAMPTQQTLVVERFFDTLGDMHLVLHAPFGNRLNKAWGLALRKRFCQRFNFELQAAATDDAILLSLGPTHSFELAEVWRYLSSATVRDVLTQALLDAPMFGVRWRWNATRALAVLRTRQGKRVPPQLQRSQAEDLLAVVFPDQQACLENLSGAREIPDHPLVAETLRDCLDEAMDLEGLEGVLVAAEAGALELVTADLSQPSPFAAEVITAKPYAFLDDAPAEERRTLAVHQRRWLKPEDAGDLGKLDAEAVARVREEAWPLVRDADELHEALVLHGFLTVAEVTDRAELCAELSAARRAACLRAAGEGQPRWVAAERLPELLAVYPGASLEPAIEVPASLRDKKPEAGVALVELLRGRLEALGPVTEERLYSEFELPLADLRSALIALEAEGFVLRGRFDPDIDREQWCERRLLARIHRSTLTKLRKEIRPVTTSVFAAFLSRWQHLDEPMQGADALGSVLEQLEGFGAAAMAWEDAILPARIHPHRGSHLDQLCLSGRWAWTRLRDAGSSMTARTTPIALVQRERLEMWRNLAGGASDGDAQALPELSGKARLMLEQLDERGPSFYRELARGQLPSLAEAALGELVARGLVTSDSFAGLRSLLLPASKRSRRDRGGRRPQVRHPHGLDLAGRWSRVRAAGADIDPLEAAETLARTLLRRWGVVVRKLLLREGQLGHWRTLLKVFRRLEARGEIRGGRFVEAFGGEQYALPEALALLRQTRRDQAEGAAGKLISISACDPLNLTGILSPEERVPASPNTRILLRDGLPIAVLDRRGIRYLHELGPEQQAAARKELRPTAIGSV
jgi:ATP-dependent Lhr-like helicase